MENTKIGTLLEKLQLPEAICEARDKWERAVVGFLLGDKNISAEEARLFDKTIAIYAPIAGVLTLLACKDDPTFSAPKLFLETMAAGTALGSLLERLDRMDRKLGQPTQS